MRVQFCFIFIIFFLLGLNSSIAATYYVATSGDDRNTGTLTSPFRTVAFAVKKMNAGDTTYVRGGFYVESLVQFSKSGTQSAPIKLLNYRNESPILNFKAKAADGARILLQNGAGYNLPIGWITIEGFEIQNGRNGIKFYNLHNSIIRRNWIHDSVGQGILGNGGHHNLFDRNRINHNGGFESCAAGELTSIGTSVCNQDHGLYMHGNFYTITNNLVYDNLAYGLQINGSSTSVYNPVKHAGRDFAGSSDWLIANNTFAYNFNRSGITVWSAPKNIRIENNIFYENCANPSSPCNNVQGVDIDRGARNVSLSNNLFFASGPGATLPFTPDIEFTNSNNIFGNPNFANAPERIPSSPNFALRSNSPALDKGLTITATRIDFKGVVRPQGEYDIGALEFTTGTSASTIPKAPGRIQIK